jgi:hypothetical protein
MSEKTTLLTEAETEFMAFERAIAGLSEPQMREVWLGTWGDAWNARFADARKGAATADIVKELDASHTAFMQAAAGVPDERYVPGKTAHKIVDLNSRHHYHEHRQQIEEWRRRKSI